MGAGICEPARKPRGGRSVAVAGISARACSTQRSRVTLPLSENWFSTQTTVRRSQAAI